MDNSPALPDETIISKIYLVREKKIMLDRDLAELYGVKTKALKQAVKRNIERFPDDFMLRRGYKLHFISAFGIHSFYSI